MKIFVTGGAGYIGSIAAQHLLENGYEVIIFDNLATGHRQAVPGEAQFIQGDLSDLDLLNPIFSENEIDAVMHFAAATVVSESMTDPSKYFQNNITNGINLLDAMQKNNIKTIVFSSSAATYGEPETIPIPEDAPTIPTNPYGESKLTFEKILHWYNKIFSIKYISLRYFNVAGATETLGEDHRPETHLIPLTLQAASGKKEYLEIYGDDYDTPDGTCIRDYIHVSDLAQAHILALNAPESTIYNLGNKNGFSIKQVLVAAEKVVGKKIPSKIAARRKGDPSILVASSEKIQRELGWKPKYPEIETIIESAWKWHLKHPNGYEE